jgi:hypothetical protein
MTDFTAVGNSLVELSLTRIKIVGAELIEDFQGTTFSSKENL